MAYVGTHHFSVYGRAKYELLGGVRKIIRLEAKVKIAMCSSVWLFKRSAGSKFGINWLAPVGSIKFCRLRIKCSAGDLVVVQSW